MSSIYMDAVFQALPSAGGLIPCESSPVSAELCIFHILDIIAHHSDKTLLLIKLDALQTKLINRSFQSSKIFLLPGLDALRWTNKTVWMCFYEFSISSSGRFEFCLSPSARNLSPEWLFYQLPAHPSPWDILRREMKRLLLTVSGVNVYDHKTPHKHW